MTIRDIAIAFGYEVDKQSEKKVNDSIDTLKSAATKALGAIAIGLSIVNATQIIEEFKEINNRIKKATRGLSDQHNIQNKIVDAANAARVAYADIASVTTELVEQSSDLFDVSDAVKYAELTTKVFKSELKSQDEILSLQETINRSFADGAVSAETVNSILDDSPTTADLLAKKVGVARSELLQMATDGRISLEHLRDAFLDSADEIEAAFADVDLTITDALLNIRNQWGLWLTQMDQTLGVTRTIAKVMTRTFTQFMNILRKAQTYTERFVDKMGGSENALKLLAMAAGAILTALNAGKILAFLKAAMTLITGINLKTIALVAAILLIALAIDDFINFMKGNDSVIGAIFEKWGIDADEVRKAIIKTWEGIKEVLLRTWDAIKDILKGALQFLTGAFTGDWGKAFNGLKEIVNSTFSYIEDVFGKFAPVVKAVVVAFAAWKTVQVFTDLTKGTVAIVKQTGALIANTVSTTANTVSRVASTVAQKAWNVAAKTGSVVTKGLGSAFKFLASPAGLAVMAIAALVAIIVMLVRNGGDVDALVQQFTDGLNSFLGVIEKVVAGIAEKAPQIIEAIVNAITKVIDVIIEKLPMFIDMGIKLIMSLLDGIVKMLPVIVDAAIKIIVVIITAIVNMLPKLLEAGIKLIAALIEGVVSMLPTIIDAVIKLVLALVNAFVNLLPKLIEVGILLIVSLINGVMSALPQVIAAIAVLVPTIVKVIANSLPTIIKAGIQIILSLVSGIVSSLPQIIQAIVGVIPVLLSALMKVIPQLIKAGIEIVTAVASGLIQAIPTLLKAIPQIIGAVLDGFEALFPELASIFDGVKKQSEIAFTAIAKIFETVIGIIKTVFGIFKSLFTGDWQGLWNGIKSYFAQVWELIKTVFSAALDTFKNVLSTFGKAFKSAWDYLAAIVKANIAVWQAVFVAIGAFFKTIWNAVIAFFTAVWETLTAIVTSAGETARAIFTAVGEFFKAIWNGILAFFQAVWDGMVITIHTFFSIFKTTFTAVSDFFKVIWSGISSFFNTVWDGIKSVFNTAVDFFGGVFTKAADSIKSAFSGIKEFFSMLFQGVANVVKAPINGIISGINNVLGGLNKVKIPDWVPGLGGKSLSFPPIPQLAKGGVLKKGQKGYLEGDGTEAVVPLEKNTEWVQKVATLFKRNMPDSGAEIVKGVTDAIKGIGGVIGKAVKTVADKASTVKDNADNSGITDVLQSFSTNIATLAKNATASPGTVRSMVSSTTNRSVTQNNYFESTFNGDRAGQQRSSEAMNRSANDATGQLARALAYAR